MVKLIHQATQFLGCGCLPSLGFIIPSHCPCKNLRSVMEGLPCYLHRIFAHWMQTNKMVPDFQLFETYASRLPLSSSAQEWPQIWAISLDWGRQGCIHMTWVRPLSPLFFFLVSFFSFSFFFHFENMAHTFYKRFQPASLPKGQILTMKVSKQNQIGYVKY